MLTYYLTMLEWVCVPDYKERATSRSFVQLNVPDVGLQAANRLTSVCLCVGGGEACLDCHLCPSLIVSNRVLTQQLNTKYAM